MLDAFALGILAQSSLFLAGLLVCWVTLPPRLVGALAGFGAGALIAAVSFDLIPEAANLDAWQMALWMLIGLVVFLGGDYLVERRFGSEGTGGAMGIVVGSVVDGVPESIIFGIQVATGFPVSASFLSAVFVSNIPQALRPRLTYTLRAGVSGASAGSGFSSWSPVGSRPRSGSPSRTCSAPLRAIAWRD